jgi:hypothetical protein
MVEPSVFIDTSIVPPIFALVDHPETTPFHFSLFIHNSSTFRLLGGI